MSLENDPEFRAYAKHVRESLVPMLTKSSIVVSIVPEGPDGVDVKFAVELGLAIMLNKPIIAPVRPGTQIPEKLSRVVDRFVEFSGKDMTALGVAVKEALADLQQKGEGA